MNLNALVLNADFQPLSIAPLSFWSFERTMRNVMRDRVIVIEHHDAELRSQRSTWRPPSVVALKNWVPRADRVAFNRMGVFLRDAFTCQYCGEVFSSKDLTFDHVIPRCRGGGSNYENIVAACVPCNQRKANRLDMKPIRLPRVPKAHELMRMDVATLGKLHATQRDTLYWLGLLDP